MKIECISSFNKLPLKQESWNALVNDSLTNTPFQTYEWYFSWWSVFGVNYSLYVLLGWEKEKIVGIAPLMIDKRLYRKTLRFIGDMNGDYCDFITSPEWHQKFIDSIFSFLKERSEDWSTIHLLNIPEQSPTLPILKRLLTDYSLLYELSWVACPYIPLNNFSTEDTWHTSRTLQRHINYFNREGELTYTVFSTETEAEQHLDTLFAQHIARWDKAGVQSIFKEPKYKEFYRKLLHNAWPSGWIFFSCLKFNQKAIACHFGFDYGEKIIWYKPSFDISFHNRSPGRILLKYLIDIAIQKNQQEFDFTIGDEPFKRSYTQHIRKNSNIHIFSQKNMFYLHVILHRILKFFKRLFRMRKSKALQPN